MGRSMRTGIPQYCSRKSFLTGACFPVLLPCRPDNMAAQPENRQDIAQLFAEGDMAQFKRDVTDVVNKHRRADSGSKHPSLYSQCGNVCWDIFKKVKRPACLVVEHKGGEWRGTRTQRYIESDKERPALGHEWLRLTLTLPGLPPTSVIFDPTFIQYTPDAWSFEACFQPAENYANERPIHHYQE